MLKQVQHDAENGVRLQGRGLVNRNGNHFRGSLELKKLSRQRLQEAPHSVIPNLFRDLLLNQLKMRVRCCWLKKLEAEILNQVQNDVM